MKYAELLDKLIQESGLTAKDISDKCREQGIEVTPSYISLLRNKEKNRIPSNEVSTALAIALGKNENYLLLEGYMDSAPEILKYTVKAMYKNIVTMGIMALQIPVNQEQINEMVEQQPMAEIIISINENMNVDQNINDLNDMMSSMEALPSMLLPARDDAMSPTICKGDEVSIERQEAYASGDMVAVATDMDMESVICRKMHQLNDEVLLLPYNSKVEAMRYDPNTMQILGKITSVTKAL
ncbi:MAG: S24 family peptidase [Oscillospiraceae bacterium]